MIPNTSENDSYKKIVKNTVAYGGSQVVQMLVTLLRAKIVAVLLGSLWMGINTLTLSAISIIQQIPSQNVQFYPVSKNSCELTNFTWKNTWCQTFL